MKAVFFALILGASTMVSAAPVQTPWSAGLSLSVALDPSSLFETKGRTGSTRVGGKGRSGKGGRYVGGHK
ncbi:hypothetical protein OIN59_16585 [Acidovorax sp. D2M1]|uniref:Uncharacterized protein n=1 Tax=Acidovorax benzenivorans TaxID=2987520 RepID=A0ABT5RZC6_9BURK|nr:hypothetical protein [Acidovorax benzenivorans]MDD2179056.1 hypothetical protein [Acidovorax benzenivorans]